MIRTAPLHLHELPLVLPQLVKYSPNRRYQPTKLSRGVGVWVLKVLYRPARVPESVPCLDRLDQAAMEETQKVDGVDGPFQGLLHAHLTGRGRLPTVWREFVAARHVLVIQAGLMLEADRPSLAPAAGGHLD